jgi:hypothetical protein
MTLIDLPWRHAKQDTRQQAQRAWKNGGPIPHELLGLDWDPVPTKDFTKLVPLAMAGDDDAKYTLQVAGGIALVTDKLLLSNTGSALASEQVPFRSNVNEVVTNLGNSGRSVAAGPRRQRIPRPPPRDQLLHRAGIAAGQPVTRQLRRAAARPRQPGEAEGRQRR